MKSLPQRLAEQKTRPNPHRPDCKSSITRPGQFECHLRPKLYENPKSLPLSLPPIWWRCDSKPPAGCCVFENIFPDRPTTTRPTWQATNFWGPSVFPTYPAGHPQRVFSLHFGHYSRSKPEDRRIRHRRKPKGQLTRFCCC